MDRNLHKLYSRQVDRQKICVVRSEFLLFTDILQENVRPVSAKARAPASVTSFNGSFDLVRPDVAPQLTAIACYKAVGC